MKAAVLYYSRTGKTKQVAQYIIDGMISVEGVEAKSFDIENIENIEDIDMAFLKESRCIIIGTPTHMADSCTAIHQWMEDPFIKINLLAEKLGGAFATAKCIYGGSELAINGILIKMLVAGMLVYSGRTFMGPVAIDPDIEQSAEVCKIYGQRMAQKALDIFTSRPC
jgi:NAD(P)H dehydrogenase (quinone)